MWWRMLPRILSLRNKFLVGKGDLSTTENVIVGRLQGDAGGKVLDLCLLGAITQGKSWHDWKAEGWSPPQMAALWGWCLGMEQKSKSSNLLTLFLTPYGVKDSSHSSWENYMPYDAVCSRGSLGLFVRLVEASPDQQMLDTALIWQTKHQEDEPEVL